MNEATVDEYVKQKIKVFNQLCIQITPKQIEHMKTLDSEVAIDNYAHDLIVKGMERF